MAKVRAGEDFEDLAREYSEDVSGRNGGKIGPVALGNLVPEFEKVAFSLKEGEISDLVETKYGLHIIRVDKREEGHTQPLEEVKDAIADRLGREARATAYNSWMDELRAKAFIETFLFDEEGDKKVKDVAGGTPPAPAPVTVKAPATPGADLETVEAQLSRIKELYARKQISESEYNKRKQALLDRL